MRIKEVLFAVLMVGCADRHVARVDPEQTRVEVKDLPAIPEKDVDILFLIDNSGSMLAEQQSLQANFPKFMQVLETLEGGAPNMHIGVATSNMGQKATDGTGTNQIGGCAGAGDDGKLRTAPGIINGSFIIDELVGTTRNRNYTGTLGDAFSAIAGVGVDGCGIEQHLASVQRTLENRTANAGFLRDNAMLAVIVIADEDDCSAAHNNLFQGTAAELNFRCTKTGITCPGVSDLSKPGQYTDCAPNDQSQYLEPVDKYVDFIKTIKPNWRQNVLVAGIVGDDKPFEIQLDAMNNPQLAPSCTYGGNQTAVPALRTKDFLEQFSFSVQRSICGADLSQAMVDIGAQLKRLVGDPCWEGEILDMDPDAAGLQPDCTIVDVKVLPDGSSQELGSIAQCGTGVIPCWKLEVDAVQCFYTSTQLKIVIDRGGVIPPADVQVRASCVTKVPPGGFM